MLRTVRALRQHDARQLLAQHAVGNADPFRGIAQERRALEDGRGNKKVGVACKPLDHVYRDAGRGLQLRCQDASDARQLVGRERPEDVDHDIPDPRALLKKYGLGAKKSWGQNFLVDERVYAGIVADHARRRQVIDLGAQLTHLATTGADVADLVAAGRAMLDTATAGGWPTLIPIGTGRHLPSFPAEVLPGWVAEMVFAVAEFTQTPLDLAAMAVDNGARAGMEVPCPCVITEALPELQDFVERCRGKRRNIGPARHETVEIWSHSRYCRLLQHDFAEPDEIRIRSDARGGPPRQGAATCWASPAWPSPC